MPRRRIAPLMMLLLLIVVLIPMWSSSSGAADDAPQLTLLPSTAQTGDRITASGEGFPSRARGQLIWGPTGATLAAIRTQADGTFRVRFIVPAADLGTTEVVAVIGDVSAEAAFVVAETEATGEPSAEPTRTAATEPSASTDTAVPSETPTVTATDVSTATVPSSPTDVPVPTEPPGPSAAEAPGIAAAALPTGSSSLPTADDRVVMVPTGSQTAPRSLRVDADPVTESYLRFAVEGITEPVAQVTLELWVLEGTPNGPTVGIATGDWVEGGLSWDNRPVSSSPLIGAPGAMASGTWVTYDVTDFVGSDGIYTFVLAGESADGVTFASREDRTSAHRPQLVVTTNAVDGVPTATATTETSMPTASVTLTPPLTEAAATSTRTPTLTGTVTTTRTPTLRATSTPTPVGAPDSGETATLLAAGDIATCGGSGDEATAKLLDGLDGTVATLGDNVYDSGTAKEYADCYAPTWGRHKDRTRPAAGNHDYRTAGAAGYFGYFGSAAGSSGTGWYSYDLGSWHIIVLNSNLDMSSGSTQVAWLTSDLAAHPATCTLAYWHHPRFSSGSEHGDDAGVQGAWAVLAAAGADVVLAGHDHGYERFAPMDEAGNADRTGGIREFVVGTGGASHYGFGAAEANSEVRNGDTFGVLKLTLRPTGYDWQFVPVAGKTFTDTGSGTCH